MKKLLQVTAALAAAVTVCVAFWILFTLPPHRQSLLAFDDGSVPGVVHIHTNRSDGLSSPDEIAAAAARAGLTFIVFTDHGDATRVPEAPVYRSGVLCLDGVEISTNGGHYIALDMPAAPYPIAGEARDVVEDVRRFGGFGIAAHPDSPKPQLRWRDWTTPFDAVEFLNPDTSWRVLAEQSDWPARRQLIRGLLGYALRPAEVMASLIQPTRIVRQWEALAERRRVVAIAGVDAHAKLALRSGADVAQGRFVLPVPGYESSFRMLSIRARPDAPLTGNAPDDARLIMRAIRSGHLYTVVDGLATPPAFDFTATNDHGMVHEGDEIMSAGPLMLHVRTNAPSAFTTLIHEGLSTLAAQRGAEDWTVHARGTPGVFWVEIVSNEGPQPVTWLRSNPVYVRGPEDGLVPPAAFVAAGSDPIFDGRTAAGWHVEHDPASRASVDVSSTSVGELLFTYALAATPDTKQVTVLAVDTPHGIAASTHLALRLRSDKPMRISVQLRDGVDPPPEDRWQRSIFIDGTARERLVSFDDMTPVGLTHTAAPPLTNIRTILFVVDRTNAKAAASGRVWLMRAELQH